MKTDNKKLAAAIAAVYAHISSIEQAAMSALPAEQPVSEAAVQTVAPVLQPNVWGMSGRQSQMQANTMIQLRAFK